MDIKAFLCRGNLKKAGDHRILNLREFNYCRLHSSMREKGILFPLPNSLFIFWVGVFPLPLRPQPLWRLPRMPWGFSACGFVAGGEAPLARQRCFGDARCSGQGRWRPWAFALALASVCVSVCVCVCVCVAVALRCVVRVFVFFGGGGGGGCVRFASWCALLCSAFVVASSWSTFSSSKVAHLLAFAFFVPLSFCACGAAVLSFLLLPVAGVRVFLFA